MLQILGSSASVNELPHRAVDSLFSFFAFFYNNFKMAPA